MSYEENKLLFSLHKPKRQYENLLPEPMTLPSPERYCYMPIQHPDIDKNYETQLDRFWKHWEIDFSQDARDWARLNSDEQHFIATNLAFFANSDNAVMENLFQRFLNEIQWPEARLALTHQAAMEGIHVKSYNMMIDAVIPDVQEKYKLFHAVEHHPVIADQLEWATKWAGDPNYELFECFFPQGFVEGVFFAPNFAGMFWLRKRGLCPGIGFGNEKIVEDESLHVKLQALLYKNSVNKMLLEDVYSMAEEVVEIENNFVDTCLPYKVKGMNAELMKKYVEKVTDTVLEEFGVRSLYGTSNPFPFMEGIGMISKANQFEKRVSEYQGIMEETEITEQTFTNLGNDLDF